MYAREREREGEGERERDRESVYAQCVCVRLCGAESNRHTNIADAHLAYRSLMNCALLCSFFGTHSLIPCVKNTFFNSLC